MKSYDEIYEEVVVLGFSHEEMYDVEIEYMYDAQWDDSGMSPEDFC